MSKLSYARNPAIDTDLIEERQASGYIHVGIQIALLPRTSLDAGTFDAISRFTISLLPKSHLHPKLPQPRHPGPPEPASLRLMTTKHPFIVIIKCAQVIEI